MVAAGGYIAAMAAGAKYSVNLLDTYTHLMQERLFDPLGMSRTTFDFDKAVNDSDHALPYKINPELQQVEPVAIELERYTIPVAPAGAIWSSANDMAKFLQTLLDPNGTGLVGEETLLLMQSPEVVIGDQAAYGIGWLITDYRGQREISHNGSTMGFSSDLSFLPDAGIGVVVLTNRSGGDSFAAAVREYVFEQVFGLEHKSAAIFLATQAQYLQLYDQLAAAYATIPVFDPIFMIDYWGDYDYHVKLEISELGEILLKSDFIGGVIMATSTPGFFVGQGNLFSWVFEFGLKE
jgi:CubicO group peptidase (beta-lactamase class C family)